MEPYNFEKFVQQIQNMKYDDMILHCQKRCKILEASSYGVKGAVKKRELGSTQLAADIKDILFWLYHGKKPLGMDEGKFQRLYSICENLVEKGQFEPEATKIFGH